MVLEIVRMEAKPGMEAELKAGVGKATALFQRAQGCQGMELRRSLERPTRYLLFVRWATLEDHAVRFRRSPAFQEFRDLVRHCLAEPSEVEHSVEAVNGF